MCAATAFEDGRMLKGCPVTEDESKTAFLEAMQAEIEKGYEWLAEYSRRYYGLDSEVGQPNRKKRRSAAAKARTTKKGTKK